jgi:hypothetical protein
MKGLAHLACAGLLAGVPMLVAPTSAVADDDRRERRPIQAQTPLLFIAEGSSGLRQTMFTVPERRALVIEYFACSISVPADQTIFPSVATTGGGVFADFVLLPVEQPNGAPPGFGAQLVVSQPVRIFADPGTTVALEIARSAAKTGAITGFCSFAGELSRVD